MATRRVMYMQTKRPEQGLRILWVKMGGLWPANSGGRLRSFHTINELSRRHAVTVLTTHSASEDISGLQDNLAHCTRVQSFEFSPPKKDSKKFWLALAGSWLSSLPVDLYKHQCAELAHEVKKAMDTEEYDLCIADFLTAVPNVPMAGSTPVLLFSHNVEYVIWRRLCDNERSWIRKLLLYFEWKKMRRAEMLACNKAVATICVSEDDAIKLRHGSPDAMISAIPTGVDTDYFSSRPDVAEKPDSLVFSGSMDWFPNEDAMLYFMADVLPSVRRAVPELSMTIVGRNPSEKLRSVARRNAVDVTGTVADIRPWLASASLYIVPLRAGGGTRLKIYEALAMGKAVLSTSIGAEGLGLKEGITIVRADTASDFANKTVTLLADAKMRKKLGDNAMTLMTEKHAWSGVATAFELLCRQALLSVREKSALKSDIKTAIPTATTEGKLNENH